MSRWTPNDELVDTVRSQPVALSLMSAWDRIWVVTCLTCEGWTAQAIADQMQCSLRTVRYIRSQTYIAEYAYELREKVRNTDAR